VQVSGTTLWTTDHNLVLHQDGHVVYRTTGQDKTALTGSDAIWFEYKAGKIGGERTMTVANTESHNLTIDGTGSGVGSGGWSGNWKYHYQSEDLVDDTDTKKFSWTDDKWSQTDHTFRTDHKGSSWWWFDMGRTYNQVYDPELGSWRTEIENQKMGGSSSYHEVKWGGANNYQFSDKRGGSSFKNGSGSGSYGFNLSGSGGSSAYSSAETASYRDNRAGTVVNGVTTYSSVDIHSLSEKTSWSESQNQTLQVTTWTRNDDWSRDEITITGDSNSLTTTKNNAFTKAFAYANGTGSGAPGTGGYSLGDNKSSTGTTTGAANAPILGGNYNNTLPGTPGSFAGTQNYRGGNRNPHQNGRPFHPSGAQNRGPNGWSFPQPPMTLLDIKIISNNLGAWDQIRDLNGLPDGSDALLSRTGYVNGRMTPIGGMGYDNSKVNFGYRFSHSQILDQLKLGQEHLRQEALSNSRNYQDPIDKIDSFFAGYADAMTFGGSTYLRGKIYGETATKNHQGAYFEAGQWVGTAHGFALGGAANATGKVGAWAIRGANWYTKIDTAVGMGSVGYKFVYDPGSLSVWDGLNFSPLIGTGLSKLVGFGKATGFLKQDFCLAGLFGCFPAGTKVSTPQGLKSIEDIQVGEEVFGYDFHGKAWKPARVGKTFKRSYFGGTALITVEGETIQATYHHPFWVVRGQDLETRKLLDHLPPVPENCQSEGRWVDASDLRVGDELLGMNGKALFIHKLEFLPFEGDVYNLQVDNFHSFFIGNIELLVHNSYSDDILKKFKNSKHQLGFELQIGSMHLRKLKKRNEAHHIASDKDKIYTPIFEEIFRLGGLNLQSPWNRTRVPGHSGAHGKFYNKYILQRLQNAVKDKTGKLYRQSLLDELYQIRREIQNGSLGDLLRAGASFDDIIGNF